MNRHLSTATEPGSGITLHALPLALIAAALFFTTARRVFSAENIEAEKTAHAEIMDGIADGDIFSAIQSASDRVCSHNNTPESRSRAVKSLIDRLELEGVLPALLEQYVDSRFGWFDHKKQDGFITPEELAERARQATCPLQTGLIEYLEKHSRTIARSVNNERNFEDCISSRDLKAYSDDLSGAARSFPTGPGSHSGTMRLEGKDRSFRLFTPSTYNGSKNLPLVILLHGACDDAERMAEVSGFDDLAEQEGFIAIYPLAETCLVRRGRTWNVGESVWWSVDDVVYIDTLIRVARQKLSIDNRRVYIAGFSNGAMLAHEIATRLPERVTAIATIGGTMNGTESAPSEPVSVLIIHGSDDEVVPIDGRRCFTGYWFFTMKSSDFVLSFWKDANDATLLTKSSNGAGIRMESFQNAAGKGTVTRYIIDGGTHVWPGSDGCVAPDDALDATQVIWEFFKKHLRP